MNRLEPDLFCRPRIAETVWILVVVAFAFPIRFNVIAQDRKKQQFVIDFEKASLNEVEYNLKRAHPNLKRGNLKQTIPFPSPDNGALDLDIFIDRSIIEVFVNSKGCLVQRVYPTRHDSTQFRLFSEDGRVKASKLVKWEMDATNPW